MTSWTTERREVSSVKSLQFNDKPSDKSFRWGPKIDPCGTSEVTPFQEECWQFNTIFCFPYFEKSFKRYNRFLDIPLRRNFRIIHSCQTSLSRASICLKTLPLLRDHYQKIDIFRGWQKGVDLCKSRQVKSLTSWMIIFIKNLNSSLNKSFHWLFSIP